MKERYSEAETKKVAEKLLSLLVLEDHRATVVGLQGDLGAGKTTLTKAIGSILGVEEVVQSPTFVIAKFYPTADNDFVQLIHIDAYRIESLDELAPIGWEELLARPKTLIIVEWPERIAAALPADAHMFSISHDDTHRVITHE